MHRNASILVLLVLALAAGSGCSSKPSASETKKGAPALDRIQGRSQVLIESGGAMGNALNAGSESSVYIWVGLRRYRLFFKTTIDVTHGKDYVVEGVYAQGVIDAIGDPDEGKNGYPLLSSCRRVITKAWNDLPLDAYDLNAQVLRTRVSRFPARPVFLVTRIAPVAEGGDATAAAKKDDTDKDKDVREVSVPAEKQRALLIESPPVPTAPLWEPQAESVKCNVVIGTDGKIDRLDTGKQLCESVDWSKYRYQPPAAGGHPVKVSTEVEVRFEPRKVPTS
jgi:hypothetical protein